MEVYMNDNRIEDLTIEEGTLEDALHTIQSEWCHDGQVVLSFRCDGVEVPAGDMEDKMLSSVSTTDRLEVYTGDPGKLVSEAMEQAIAALKETTTHQGQIAEMLNEGKTAEGVETLAQSLKVWQQVNEAAVKSIQMLRIDPENITVQGKPFVEVIDAPRQLLVQVKEALTSQDYVLLADVLKYEFDDTQRQWEALLEEIRIHAEHMVSSEN